MEEVKNMLKQSILLPAWEVNCHLNLMLVKLQKSHECVTKAGMFLPTYDIKRLELHSMKPQKMMNSLNTQFQEGQEKVKTKKKVSKSPSRRLPQLQSWLLISPDSPWWMQVQRYSCSLSYMADQSVILTRKR